MYVMQSVEQTTINLPAEKAILGQRHTEKLETSEQLIPALIGGGEGCHHMAVRV